MKEIADIVSAFEQAQQEGLQCALATVVHLEGSAYRRPGARMLVTEDGRLTGAISGGCLEGDALRKALLVMAQQKALLVTYDTTDEDDTSLGIGLGCNGIIHILIEPINAGNETNPIALFKQLLAQRQPAVLVTLFSLQNRNAPQPGTCLLLQEENCRRSKAFSLHWPEAIMNDAWQALHTQTGATKTYLHAQQPLNAFIEWLQPPVSLVIIGAGNDVLPLVQMANVLGWQVTVADGRRNYATPQRFPQVHRLIVAKPGQVLQQLQVDEQTVFVLMTHNFHYDLDVLRQLLTQKMAYTGILGPHKKMARMLETLQEEGIVPGEAQLARLYGPTGLDIGAETAEEIALSILSEIKAVLSNRKGQSLRDKSGGIHENPHPGKLINCQVNTLTRTSNIS